MRNAVLATVAVFVAAMQLPAYGAELAVYRDAAGNLTPSSRKSLAELRRVARAQGELAIWVMFDMAFEAESELRTLSVIQSEAAERQSLIRSVLVPLGEDVSVLDTPSGLEEAPGCLVSTTAEGLVSIVRSKKVKHISYYPQ